MVAKARAAVVATERAVGPMDRAARAATATVGEGMEVERVSAVAGRARAGAVKEDPRSSCPDTYFVPRQARFRDGHECIQIASASKLLF